MSCEFRDVLGETRLEFGGGEVDASVTRPLEGQGGISTSDAAGEMQPKLKLPNLFMTSAHSQHHYFRCSDYHHMPPSRRRSKMYQTQSKFARKYAGIHIVSQQMQSSLLVSHPASSETRGSRPNNYNAETREDGDPACA